VGDLDVGGVPLLAADVVAGTRAGRGFDGGLGWRGWRHARAEGREGGQQVGRRHCGLVLATRGV